MPQLLKSSPRRMDFLPADALSAAPRPCSTPVWPGVAEVMAARGSTGVAAWCKTWYRHLLSQPHQTPLLNALAAQPAWAQRFEQDASYFHCVSSHFVDRRLGMAQRIRALSSDLDAAHAAFSPQLAARIAQGECVRLWSLNNDAHLCLGLNDVSYHEGLWALSLRDSAGGRLYYLSLCFGPDGSLLVPTLQGPAGTDQAPRDVIRQLTKKAEGLRPQALLMAGLRAACAAWQISHLAGVAPENHIKGRWNHRGKRLRFDYAALWHEQGGELAAHGHWALPLVLPQRPPQDVPAQKRAMYRRRQVLLDTMASSVAEALGRPLSPAWALAA